MQALQVQAQTSGQLAAQFGVSDRHIRRTIADLILEKKVVRQRDGRDFLYSLAAAVVEEDAATTTITAPAGTADNCGQNVRDRDLGHTSDNDGTISDMISDIRGHGKIETSKQRHRINKRTPDGYGPAAIGPRSAPGSSTPLTCMDNGTNLCPQFYAGYERDKIQFVLVDRIFHDLLVSKARQWTTRTPAGQLWIYPVPALTLQVGKKDSVVFYSAEPGDMSAIAAWVKDTFPEYGDMDSLVKRIKHPQSLVAEELTVVVRHKETIEAIRSSIGKLMVNGTYDVQHPSEAIPGLKVYESNATMRVEFVVHNHKTGASAVDMREELMWLMPRIHRTPGLFWEFVQKYYSALHHPLIIDTGGHEFLGALQSITGQFTDALRTIADKIPQAPTQQDLQLRELRDAIEALESSELGDIIRTFRDLVNVEEAPTRVFLAGWSVWLKRNFKGRVTKADIAALLLRANEPLAMDEIAAALPVLRTAGLLQEDARLEICYSPAGAEIARILMAKREGI